MMVVRSLREILDFPAESSEKSAGNRFPADFAKDLHSQVIPSWVIVPEDFRNRRKCSCGNFLRKSEIYPQEIFGQNWMSFPARVCASCVHTAGNSAVKAAGNSAAIKYQQQNPEQNHLKIWFIVVLS